MIHVDAGRLFLGMLGLGAFMAVVGYAIGFMHGRQTVIDRLTPPR